jgi:hypothetical protein
MTAEHEGSALATFIDMKFRRQTAGDLVDAYGSGANGLNYWLSTATAKIGTTPAGKLNTAEITYIDKTLATAWAKTNAALGAPTNWRTWFRESELHVSVIPYATIEQLPPIDATLPPFKFGPFMSGNAGTLHSDFGQSYSQVVEIGKANLKRSLLMPGQAEQPGPFQLNQIDIHFDSLLKPVPEDRANLEALGNFTLTPLN